VWLRLSFSCLPPPSAAPAAGRVTGHFFLIFLCEARGGVGAGGPMFVPCTFFFPQAVGVVFQLLSTPPLRSRSLNPIQSVQVSFPFGPIVKSTFKKESLTRVGGGLVLHCPLLATPPQSLFRCILSFLLPPPSTTELCPPEKFHFFSQTGYGKCFKTPTVFVI